MYQCAEMYLPRKKKVRDNFNSNTFRIFDEKILDRLDPDKVYKAHSYSTRDPKEYDLHKIHNIPQPRHAKFIRTNVRFLNAPVSHMETERTMAEQSKWWSNSIEPDVEVKAVYSTDSTQRSDYRAVHPAPTNPVRHGPNHHRTAASGIIPTLSPLGSPKVFLEHMSFIHQYDSRKLLDQPYQGRRHGAFVWREMRPSVLGGESAFLSAAAAEEETEGAKGVTSPQPPPLPLVFTPLRNMSGGGGGAPRGRGPGVSARSGSQGRRSQLVHGLKPSPAPGRAEHGVRGGFQGVSTASAGGGAEVSARGCQGDGLKAGIQLPAVGSSTPGPKEWDQIRMA